MRLRSALSIGCLGLWAAACSPYPDMKVYVSGLPSTTKALEYVIRYTPNLPVSGQTTFSNDEAPTRILFAEHPNTDTATDYTFTARVSFPSMYKAEGQIAVDVAALDERYCPTATGSAMTLVPFAYDQIPLPLKTSSYRGTTAVESGECEKGKPQILFVAREKIKQNTTKPVYKFSVVGWPFFQTTKVTVSATLFPQLKFSSFSTKSTDNMELQFESVTTPMFSETAFDLVFFGDNIPVTVNVDNGALGMNSGSVSAMSLGLGIQQ